MLLNNQWVKEEITEEIKKYLENNENRNNVQPFRCRKRSSKRNLCRITGLPQKPRKISIQPYTLRNWKKKKESPNSEERSK